MSAWSFTTVAATHGTGAAIKRSDGSFVIPDVLADTRTGGGRHPAHRRRCAPHAPNAGRGASQAFENAYVRCRWLDASRTDPDAALEGFRSVRIPRAHAMQRRSFGKSRLVHAGDWERRQAAFEERKRAGDTPLGMSWIYDYDPAAQWSERVEYPLSDAIAR